MKRLESSLLFTRLESSNSLLEQISYERGRKPLDLTRLESSNSLREKITHQKIRKLGAQKYKTFTENTLAFHNVGLSFRIEPKKNRNNITAFNHLIK